MKKKIGIALILALVMVLGLAAPALAWGEVNVECSDIDAPDAGYVGSEVTASGTVTITSTSETGGFIPVTAAGSDAGFSVTSPDSIAVAGGSSSVSDADVGLFGSASDASQTYNWSSTFTLSQTGDWTVSQGGSAWAYWGPIFGLPPNFITASGTNFFTIMCLDWPKHEKHYITIILPDASLKVERHGTMRYCDVDFNDGTWRIQITSGVRIWDDKGGAARKLIVDENGDIMPGIWFMCGEPVVTRM